MLEVKDLTKVYRAADVETRAVAGVSFHIGAGELVAIMGPSGCGKSSLLNILGFLDTPTGGTYRIMDEDVASLSEAALTRLRREHVGFVFQNFNLIDDLTVAENVEVSLLYRGSERGGRNRVLEVLEQTGMAHRANHRPQQLSGGQQQRVAVARALASNPKIILADEPTGNLDTANGKEVMDLLVSASKSGTTILMVTHSAVDAAAAGRIIKMLDGQIVSETQL
jgi:putative ABC transport system ATP-binding protein